MKLLIAVLSLFCLPALAKLTHESELAIIAAGGNTDLQTINTATKNKYEFEGRSTVLFGGHYTYGENTGALSARNWDANGKYEFAITDRFSAVTGETIEGNRFQDVKARYNTALGGKYFFMKEDNQDFFMELAYRYSAEDRYKAENVYQQKARTYAEWNKKQSATLQWKFWLEYLPNFTAGSDWMLTGEGSMTAILSSMFSLKVAYKGLYDNLPAAPGLKNYDYITVTSLVAKF